MRMVAAAAAVFAAAMAAAGQSERTVAFVGGSITEMEGFRPRVMEMLRAKHPGVKFREIAAGLSSTCSDAGAFRLREDVLSKGTPDLFVVESAVNDDQDGRYPRSRCIRGLEGILRQVLRANPRCALVVGLMVNHGQYLELMAGKTPLTYGAGRTVAARYGAAVADVGGALAASAKAGGISWKEYKDCHPSPAGCDFGAEVVMKAIGEVFDPAKERAALAMPEAIEAGNFEGTETIAFADVAKGEGWKATRPDWAKIPGGKRRYYTRGEALWCETPGAVAEVEFEGRTLAAFLTAGPDAGALEVSVDGGEWRMFRLRADYGSLHYPYLELLADGLPAGAHRAKLRAAAEARKGGEGRAVRIHRLYRGK